MVSNGALNLNAVSEHFDISRPAISKHIKILSECGLLIIKQRGRDRHCEANLAYLGQISDWIEPYRIFWTNKFDSLEKFLGKQEKKIIKQKIIKK